MPRQEHIEESKIGRRRFIMIVKEIMDSMNLRLAAGESGLSNKIEDVYVCDLLSWVMAHAASKSAWVTIQTHPNVIAVATLMDLSCVIIPENAEIDEQTINKANEEGIPVLVSCESGYKISCQIYDKIKGY
jgi:serine kinase of HPr protein (carbohydrate metabolism regulator)